MSISGRANEHQRVPEAQPSGRQAGGQSPGPGRPARVIARANEHQQSFSGPSAGPQMSIERESAKNLDLR